MKGVKRVIIKEIGMPEIEEDEILFDVIKTGVSVGTARWALLGLRPEIKYPLVSGYLAVGKVIKKGEKLMDLKKEIW